jgi:hypothetical protein
MSGWLPGFRSAAAESSEPQPFELLCECNVRHSGLRKKSHQRIVCRTCGAALFVLPRDAYPPPPDAERIRKRRKPKPTEPEESPPSRVSRHKRRRQEQETGPSPISAAADMTSSAFQAVAGTAGRAIRLTTSRTVRASVETARGFWSFWTPLRLAGLGVLVLVTGIAVFTIRSRRIERAEQALNPAIEEGLAALERGEIPEAASRLATASDALDLLGQEDRHSQSVRAAYREARALQNLATESLLGLLEQADESVEKAGRERPKPGPEQSGEKPPPLDADWAVRFDALYKEGWFVLEAPVRKLKGTDEEPRRYQVDFPIGIGPQQRTVELRADFEIFDQLGVTDRPQTVVFGGQLSSFRYLESKSNPRWQVRFEPESGFAWVNLSTYRRLGFLFTEWHPQPEVEQILAAQAKALGVEALVAATPPEAPALPAE